MSPGWILQLLNSCNSLLERAILDSSAQKGRHELHLSSHQTAHNWEIILRDFLGDILLLRYFAATFGTQRTVVYFRRRKAGCGVGWEKDGVEHYRLR
jgi:hypothetical protein